MSSLPCPDHDISDMGLGRSRNKAATRQRRHCLDYGRPGGDPLLHRWNQHPSREDREHRAIVRGWRETLERLTRVKAGDTAFSTFFVESCEEKLSGRRFDRATVATSPGPFFFFPVPNLFPLSLSLVYPPPHSSLLHLYLFFFFSYSSTISSSNLHLLPLSSLPPFPPWRPPLTSLFFSPPHSPPFPPQILPSFLSSLPPPSLLLFTLPLPLLPFTFFILFESSPPFSFLFLVFSFIPLPPFPSPL